MIADQTFAFGRAGEAIKKLWSFEDGKFERKADPFDIYRPNGRPRQAPEAASGTVAAARALRDKAKTSGDPDSMTRTANDLLRVLEAERATDARSEPSVDTISRQPAGDAATLPSSAEDEGLSTSASGVGAADIDTTLSSDGSFVSAVAPDAPDATVTPVAWVNEKGGLSDVKIEAPDAAYWGPTNKAAAKAILDRIAVIGEAIQKYGTPEQKEAWKRIKRIVLEDNPQSLGGVAQNEVDRFRVDLSLMGATIDPKNPQLPPKPPDPRVVLFMLAHEIFHSTKSNLHVRLLAEKMKGNDAVNKVPTMGTPRWSAEVRHDKIVYDFLVKTGLLGSPPPPIQVVAPYYAQHLENPDVPVHAFPVPGYNGPI
jgi:hypothetical protein